MLCATNRVPVCYELTPASVADIRLVDELLGECGLGEDIARRLFGDLAYQSEELESSLAGAGICLVTERSHQCGKRQQAEIPEPEERMRRALSEVYAYYGCTEAMLYNVLRDAPLDPIAQENMVFLYRHWEAMRDTIADAFEASGERNEALLGAIALALDFQTWHTLVRQQGLSDERAIALMVGMVQCLVDD